MPLQQDKRSMPFVEGPDKKTDPKLSSKPEALENAVIVGGTISKCPGRKLLPSSISSGGAQTSGEALFQFEDELSRINGGTTYGLSEAMSKWVPKSGGNNYCSVALSSLFRSSTNVFNFDVAVVGKIGVFAFVLETGGLRVIVYDVETGAQIQNGDVALATAISCRCVVIAGNVVILGRSGANLLSTYIDTDSPTTPPPALTTIRTDVLTTASTFDAFTYNNVSGICAYPSTGGATMTLIAFNKLGVVLGSPAPTAFAAVTGANGLALVGVHANRDTAGNIYVVFGDSSAGNLRTRFFVASSAFALVVAATDIVTNGNWGTDTTNFAAILLTATSVELTTNQLTVFMCSNLVISTTSRASFIAKVVLSSGGIVSAFTEVPSTQGLAICSDVVAYQGTYVFGTFYTDALIGDNAIVSGIQATGYIINTSGALVSRVLTYQTGSSVPSDQSGVQRVNRSFPTPSNAGVKMFYRQQGRTTLIGNPSGVATNSTPFGVTEVNLEPRTANELSIVQVGRQMYIGGGVPRAYDGLNVVEAGFTQYPTVAIATTGSVGSGQLSAGAYQVRVLWSWVNDNGEIVRSIPSIAATFTALATELYTIEVPTLPMSTRDLLPSGVQVILEVYRTVANGSVFYRDTGPALGGLATNQVLSSGMTDRYIVTGGGTISDASLVFGELLYAQGGALDWDAPPPYIASCAHEGRLCVLPTEDPFEFWVSSQHVEGEQLRFSSINVGRVPQSTGPLTGCASMDGKLILFTRDAAYFVAGQGPDNAGNNQYGTPQRIISVDSGPTSHESISEMPLGITYQSKDGMTLLDRGLNTSLIGGEMEPYFAGAYRVRSTVVDAANESVRIISDQGSDIMGQQMGTMVPSNGGVELVNNYQYKQWSAQINRGGRDACLYNGTFSTVRSDGVAKIETPFGYLDDGQYVTTVVETSWIKMDGLNGFQRLYYAIVLGTYWSNFSFKWEVAYSYDGTTPTDPTWEQVVSLNGNGVYDDDGGPFRQRHHLGKKCTAVKFRFTDFDLGGNGRGMSLTDLTLEFGIKKGVFKLPANKTA